MNNIKNAFERIIKNNLLMLSYIYHFCPSHIFLTLFVSILASLVSVVNLFVTRYIVNTIQVGNDNHLFKNVLMIVVALFIINLIHSFINRYIQQKIIPRNTQIISRQMQSELFHKASVIEMKHYDKADFFNTFSMALQQSDARAQGVLNTLNAFVSSLFSIGALATLIAVLEPMLFVMVIVNVAISFLMNTLITKHQHSFAEERIQPQREMEYSKYIFYRLENAKELRINRNLKDLLTDKLCNANSTIVKLIEKYGKKLTLLSWIQSMMNHAMTASILVYLSYKVIKGVLLIGDFVTLTSSSQQLAMQISELIASFPQMYEHSLYIDNFKEFIAYAPPANYGEGVKITKIKSVKLQNVSFSYPLCKARTLKNINFEIKAGQRIAIVGENGAGKSTIVKLLLELYEADSGQVIINGHNISSYELNSYRECIGVVFQDYKVFALSIAENILMHRANKDGKDEETVIDALKFVGLYDKVMQLPQGIYTKLTKEFSEEGVVFSGGEIQKLALARAYVRNCSLLILDEPSSSLDPIAEREMLHKMMRLSDNKCAIIISHRLKNIKNVDCIYVVNQGKIVEYGTHKALMETRGLYFNMYSKQTHENGT